MNKVPKSVLLIMAVLLLSVPAFALSANDFLPPAQADSDAQKEQLSTVQNEAAVHTEKDENLGVEVVKAKTLQDAINSIVNKHKRGCTTADPSPNGVTFVATGMGTYNPNYKNVMASRIEQRNAYVEAFMDAKSLTYSPHLKAGDSSIINAACRNRSYCVSSNGRCPNHFVFYFHLLL